MLIFLNTRSAGAVISDAVTKGVIMFLIANDKGLHVHINFHDQVW